MTLPSWTLKLAAAATIPVMLGVGAAVSAPSFFVDGTGEATVSMDRDYVPGEFGVDFAAVTGPMGPSTEPQLPESGDAMRNAQDAVAGCEAATWPNIPVRCLDGVEAAPSRNIFKTN